MPTSQAACLSAIEYVIDTLSLAVNGLILPSKRSTSIRAGLESGDWRGSLANASGGAMRRSRTALRASSHACSSTSLSLKKRSTSVLNSSKLLLSCTMSSKTCVCACRKRKNASSTVPPDSAIAAGRTPYIHHLPSSSCRINVRPDTVILAKKPSPETVSCSVISIGWSFRSMVGSVINIISLRYLSACDDCQINPPTVQRYGRRLR